MNQWSLYLSAMVLALVRVSGIVAFAPFFSADALPARSKAVFTLVVAFLLAPVIASLPGADAEITVRTVLGEVAAGLVFGLTLALLNEILLFAGQVFGLQLSFSLVNLLDPTSSIQTPLMGELLQWMGTLVVVVAGLDRVLLASLVRSFHAVPPGTYQMRPLTAAALVQAAGGIFLAALELAAPVLAATLLVDVGVALMGKLSPQLPVMSLTVPLKTLAGFGMLIGSLALWPRFIEARFAGLLDLAQRLIASAPGSGGG